MQKQKIEPKIQHSVSSGAVVCCNPCIVYVTMPDYKTACEISRILLDERLIACANTLPNVTSMFLFDGAINTGSECITIMKTLGHLYAKLTQKIQELHPYNIPAIFSIPMQDCNQAFLDWIVDSLPPG